MPAGKQPKRQCARTTDCRSRDEAPVLAVKAFYLRQAISTGGAAGIMIGRSSRNLFPPMRAHFIGPMIYLRTNTCFGRILEGSLTQIIIRHMVSSCSCLRPTQIDKFILDGLGDGLSPRRLEQ